MQMYRDLGNKDNFITSNKYEKGLDEEVRKMIGVYYTPKLIIEYIMEKTLYKHNIIENPYPRVLDMSCGCGNFLIVAYEVLYKMFSENLTQLSQKYDKTYWVRENIHEHIIKNCIFGVDIDTFALDILRYSLKIKDELGSSYESIYKRNIICSEALTYDFSDKFDYIIGNPPYVGHKNIDKSYREILNRKYSEVYKDKADLYFCFIKKAIDMLPSDGKISLIVPRYFLESHSAKDLRKYINEHVFIEECVDFLGANIFKSVGISSCIVTLGKHKKKRSSNVFRVKDEDFDTKDIRNLSDHIRNGNFEELSIKKCDDGDWIIVDEDTEKIYRAFQDKCIYKLGDIVDNFQGIITGCDKAFIYENNDEITKKINSKYIKKWVKNKNIRKYIIDESKYSLIYSDSMIEGNDLDLFKEYIAAYIEKLQNRRECKKNIRKWYELQWGRNEEIFERTKIMYPYKSRENKFAIDYDWNFSSADVYSFYIKDEYINEFSYEYLVGILNSSVYDRYYKITAKKMSRGIYDYYPNKVLNMKIFKDENYTEIEELSKSILKVLKDEVDIDFRKIEDMKSEIDSLILDSLCLQGENMVKCNS